MATRPPLSKEELRALLEEYRAATEDEERLKHRETLVHHHLGLVEFLARRFNNRGEPLEDLIQVGTIGLLKAIDRFDLDRDVEFSTYATPTIVGELKRHFRDKGWSIRVPRRLQELHLELTKTVGRLGHELGRSPTVAELAQALGETEENIIEGLEIAHAYSPTSLDAPIEGEAGSTMTVADRIGGEDEQLEHLEYRASLAPEVGKLAPREQEILYLRFYKGMTQSEIATQLGISQMHVSRLLTRTLSQLREALEED